MAVSHGFRWTMEMLRAVCLWLLPPLIASAVCTLSWNALSGDWDLPTTGIILGGSLFFTLPGSAALVLVFSYLRPRRTLERYAWLIVLGTCVGGCVMLLVSGPSEFAVAGAVYGGTTGGLWAACHRVIYGREQR